MAVLDGELAVPCTCNPLQQGRIPGWDSAASVIVQVSGDDSSGLTQIKSAESRQDRKVATVSTSFIVP